MTSFSLDFVLKFKVEGLSAIWAQFIVPLFVCQHTATTAHLHYFTVKTLCPRRVFSDNNVTPFDFNEV